MHVKKSFMLWVAVLALALPLLLTGTASAKYMSDGSVPDGSGGWKTPNDGICVVGLHADGTMDVADGITSKRDCIYLNNGTMNGGTAFDLTTVTGVCTSTATASDGIKHAAASAGCFDADNHGISLKGLDRTSQMCTAKGGTWKTPPGCLAFGWQYRGQDASGAPLEFGTKGTPDTANAGFCYSTMQTNIAVASCPSVIPTPPTTSANASTAFGYSVSGTNCVYAYGVNGPLNGDLVTTASVTSVIGGVTAIKGATVDLTTLTTMGDCLANGGSWGNWGFTKPSAGFTTANGITAALFDLTRQAPNSDEGCLHCHSSIDQANGPTERQKDSFLKTGHKNMLRKVVAGSPWAGPNDLGGLTVYTTDGTNAINFDNATVTSPTGTVANLRYIWGDWMAALPTLAYEGAMTYQYGCGACHTEGFKDNTNPGVQSIGTPSYTPAQPFDSGAGYVAAVTAGHKWDNAGISCPRCHNAAVPSVSPAQIAASSFKTTHELGGGMGKLAAGVGRNNLCFGCHQSIAKNWPAQGGAATGTTQYDPTLIPTGVNHGQSAGRDFNGHVLGNSFLNSVHARYAGVNSNAANGGITLNSLGKYDLYDAETTTLTIGAEYGSTFRGYSCYQSASSSSPGKTKADGTEIKDKATCEGIYGAGAWRADTGSTSAGQPGYQGTCATCHDVHNSLFISGQEGIRKECVDCHANADFAAAVPAAKQYDDAKMAHPKTAGTPWDASLYGNDPCAVCHMAIQAKENGNQNSMPVHLWRINTNAAYNTFPTADQWDGLNGATKDRNAQTAPDGTYTNAVWVDLDLACGQCHGGSLGSGITLNGVTVPTLDKTQLAVIAGDMHDNTILKPNSACLTCHSAAQGTHRAINQGVDHHNGTCTTCHAAGNGHYKSAWATAGVAAPNTNATTSKLQNREAPYFYYWSIDSSLPTACLGCHKNNLVKADGVTAVPKIVPSGTGDNHHNGHSGVPGTNFGGVAEGTMTIAGSRGDNDPGMNCLGCHGKSTIVSGNSSIGYTIKIAAAGLSTSTVAAANGRTNTTGLCLGCHELIQSGTTQDHHAGTCITCHHPDGSYSGTFPAGVGTAPAGDPCLNCHATAQGASRAVNQGVNHHNGACVECHGEAGGVPAMPAPTYTITLDTKVPANRVINADIKTSCLTCHSTAKTRSSNGSTIGAIIPSGTGDNHHNGHAYINKVGSTDPGLYCLGCHGAAADNTATYAITASGLNAAVVSVQKGMLPNANNTPGLNAESTLCVQCHSNVDSGHGFVAQETAGGLNKNHHSGNCTSCHSVVGDPSNGNLPAGVASIPGGVNCTVSCHTTTPAAHHATTWTTASCEECHVNAGVRPTVPALVPTNKTSVNAYCQTCHVSAQGTHRAIVPSGTGDNHHAGSSTTTARSVAGCMYCHNTGGKPFGDASTEVIMDRVAPTSCSGACHLDAQASSGKHHTGAGLTLTSGTTCLTCHTPNSAVSEAPGVTDPAVYPNPTWADCTACHSSGGANGPSAVNHHTPQTGYTTCDSCHTNAGIAPSCTTCHTMAVTNHNSVPTCATCHSSAAGAVPGVVPTVAQACDQCHGGSTTTTTHNGAAYRTEAVLAARAAVLHVAVPTASFTWKADATTDYLVQYNASASVCPAGSICTFSWSSGETVTDPTRTASHLFTSATTTMVTLTLTANPGGSSTASASVTPVYRASNPTAVSISSAPVSGYTVTANYNVSNGVAPYTVKARWSDGYTSTMTQLSSGSGSQGHAYISAGTYTVTIIATDSGVNGANKTTAYAWTNVTLASMNISGIVTGSTGTPLSGVSLNLKLNGVSKKLITTAPDGTYTFANVVPGSYTIVASKTGYTFTNPAASPVVSDSSVIANISANAAAAINVTGLVTSSTGTPVSGVSMYLKLGGVTKKLVSTNASGSYTFANVANGDYTVVAVKSGYTFPAPVPVTVSGATQTVNISAIAP